MSQMKSDDLQVNQDFSNLITKELYEMIRQNRSEVYGEAFDNHQGIAQVWACILKPHWRDIRLGKPIPAWVVALLMMGVKYNRMRLTFHEDNFTDELVYMSMVKKWQKEWADSQKNLAKVERIFISNPIEAISESPTQDEKLKIIQAAAEAGVECLNRGHLVHIPHMSTALMDGKVDTGSIKSLDLDILRYWASAILYLGPNSCKDSGLNLAQQLGLRIYRSLDEIPTLRPKF